MKVSKKCTVKNSDGIHARPSAIIVKKASEFKASLIIHKNDGGDLINADAKSIMDLMQLAAFKGDELIIEADGDDAQEALNAIVELLETEFNFRAKDKDK